MKIYSLVTSECYIPEIKTFTSMVGVKNYLMKEKKFSPIEYREFVNTGTYEPDDCSTCCLLESEIKHPLAAIKEEYLNKIKSCPTNQIPDIDEEYFSKILELIN